MVSITDAAFYSDNTPAPPVSPLSFSISNFFLLDDKSYATMLIGIL